MAQGKEIVPIPGTKHRKYLEENLAALEVTLLKEELQQIHDIAPKGVAAGDRYVKPQMANLNV